MAVDGMDRVVFGGSDSQYVTQKAGYAGDLGGLGRPFFLGDDAPTRRNGKLISCLAKQKEAFGVSSRLRPI